MYNNILLASQTITALCGFTLAGWLLAALIRNHLERGFRPILSSLFVLSMVTGFNFSLLAVYRWGAVFDLSQQAVLATPQLAFTNTIVAVAWLIVTIAFLANGRVGHTKR